MACPCIDVKSGNEFIATPKAPSKLKSPVTVKSLIVVIPVARLILKGADITTPSSL